MAINLEGHFKVKSRVKLMPLDTIKLLSSNFLNGILIRDD